MTVRQKLHEQVRKEAQKRLVLIHSLSGTSQSCGQSHTNTHHHPLFPHVYHLKR